VFLTNKNHAALPLNCDKFFNASDNLSTNVYLCDKLNKSSLLVAQIPGSLPRYDFYSWTGSWPLNTTPNLIVFHPLKSHLYCYQFTL